MMNGIDFNAYKPQRIFLIQGNVDTYTTLHDEAKATYGVVHSLSVARFTVEHATTIASFAIEGDGTERFVAVYFSVFSPDAAQVLLKSLEEPDELTTIVFVTPYPYVVPITIRSRVALIQTKRSSVIPTKRTRAEALEYVKAELSSDSEDDAATRRANAVAYLDELETQCKADPAKARIIYGAKHMLFRANMPTKYVMEYVVSAVL